MMDMHFMMVCTIEKNDFIYTSRNNFLCSNGWLKYSIFMMYFVNKEHVFFNRYKCISWKAFLAFLIKMALSQVPSEIIITLNLCFAHELVDGIMYHMSHGSIHHSFCVKQFLWERCHVTFGPFWYSYFPWKPYSRIDPCDTWYLILRISLQMCLYEKVPTDVWYLILHNFNTRSLLWKGTMY